MVVFSEAKKFNSHEIPGISFRQTGNWTPEDEIFGINCRNVAPEQRKCFPRKKRNFIPSKRTFSTVRDYLNKNLVTNELSLAFQKDGNPICFLILTSCFPGGVSATKYKTTSVSAVNVRFSSISHRCWITLAL